MAGIKTANESWISEGIISLRISAIRATPNIMLELINKALFFLFFDREEKWRIDDIRQSGENIR